MRPLDRELYSQVCALLWEEWDPIGVNSLGGPPDEYDSYAPTLIRAIRDGADEDGVAAMLGTIARTHMGLSHIDEDRDRTVAKRLIAVIRNG